MKLSQIFTAPNQLTLLRMVFVPFIVIELVEGRYFWALLLFVIAGFSDGLDGLLARKLHQQITIGARCRRGSAAERPELVPELLQLIDAVRRGITANRAPLSVIEGGI